MGQPPTVKFGRWNSVRVLFINHLASELIVRAVQNNRFVFFKAWNGQWFGVTEHKTYERSTDCTIYKPFANGDLPPLTHTTGYNSTEWFELSSQVLPNYSRATVIGSDQNK